MPKKKQPPQIKISKGTPIGTRYSVLQHLGSGYFGSVYKVRDEFSRYFSLKMVLKEHLKTYIDSEDFKERLFSISKLLLNTRPSSLLVPYDVGEYNDFFYIVYEYVEGISLASKIEREGPLPFKQALFILSEIIKALYSLHSLKAVHGDLHAHNIYISAPALDTPYPNLFDVKIDCSIHGLGFGFSHGSPKDDINSLGLIFSRMLIGSDLLQSQLKSSELSFVLKSKNPSVNEISSLAFGNLTQLIFSMLSEDPKRKPTLEQLLESAISLVSYYDKEKTIHIETSPLVPYTPVSSEYHDVFINYAKEDIDAARKLYNFFNHYEINGWLDDEALLPGQDWQNKISIAIKNSRAFIALMSSRSVNKKGFVQKEIRQALDEMDKLPPDQIFLIPARLDECFPSHPRLHNIQWVDLFPNFFDGFERILKSLKAIGISIKEYMA